MTTLQETKLTITLPGITPWIHQTALVKLNPPKYLLPWGCGTGKTIGIVFLIKLNNPNNEPVLLISIKSDKQKWLEVAKQFNINADVYTKEEFKAKIIDKTESMKLVEDKFGRYQMKKTTKTFNRPAKVKKYNYLVIDEFHFFGGVTSRMYKSMLAYIRYHNPQFVWGGTATPYSKDPWNLFCLGNLLGFDWDYSGFKKHFFTVARGGFPVVKTKCNGIPIKKEVARYINFLGKAVKMEDCIDMPPKTYIQEYFELTPEQKKAMKEVEERAEKEDMLPMTRNMFYHEVCGGTLKITHKDEFTGEVIKIEDQFYKSQKLNRIVELCEFHKKIFIVCAFTNEINYIVATLQKKLKKRTIIEFTGKNSATRKKVADSTNDMDECIIVSQMACDAAYECPTIPLMVIYSYNNKFVNYEQITGRIRRGNYIGKRTYLALIVKGETDEKVHKSMLMKKDFDMAIFKRNN